MTVNALRWGRVSRRGTYEIPSKTSSGDDASLQVRAGSRGTGQERAGACGTKLTQNGSANVRGQGEMK